MTSPQSARDDRRRDLPDLVHASPVQPFQEPRELGRAQPQDAIVHLRPAELAILEPFGEQAYARAVPEDHLHPVGTLGSEHVHRARERVRPHRLTHEGGQAVGTFAEVHWPGRHHHANGTRRPDHELAFKARITAAIAFGLAPGPTRTATPLISSSIPLADERPLPLRARGSGRAAGSWSAAAATTAGTNETASFPASSGRRASRRHPNSCCGKSPCRRATSDTTAPGASVSSTMRALSSTDHRRRPPKPLMTSIRLSGPLGLSLWSSPDTKRSSTDRQTQPLRPDREGGFRTTLTLKRLFSRTQRRHLERMLTRRDPHRVHMSRRPSSEIGTSGRTGLARVSRRDTEPALVVRNMPSASNRSVVLRLEAHQFIR